MATAKDHEIEIVELDDRFDMTLDPLTSLLSTVVENCNCVNATCCTGDGDKPPQT